MKHFLILVFGFLSATIYGQTNGADSGIKVVYANETTREKKPAFFINGKFVGSSLPINPDDIESISILKEGFQFDSIKYDGQIHISTKKDYSLKLISLTALKEKYTNLGNIPVVFTIDGTIVSMDYDKYLVDENNLLQIIVDKIIGTKGSAELGLIKLLTKSEENIKKSKEIRIRGNEVMMN